MKPVVMVLLLCAFAVRAAETREREEIIPVLVLGTNEYRNARILRTTTTNAYVKFEGGIVRANLSDLPKELQEKYPPTADAPKKATNQLARPFVYQRIPIDLVIRNLETRIAALERIRAQLDQETNIIDTAALDAEIRTAATRRRAEIDRTLSQLQLQLNRAKAAKAPPPSRHVPEATASVRDSNTEDGNRQTEGPGPSGTPAVQPPAPGPTNPTDARSLPRRQQPNVRYPNRAPVRRY